MFKSLVQSIQSDKYNAGFEKVAGLFGTDIQSILSNFVLSVLYFAKYLIRFSIVSFVEDVLSILSDKTVLSQSDKVNHDTDVHNDLHV